MPVQTASTRDPLAGPPNNGVVVATRTTNSSKQKDQETSPKMFTFQKLFGCGCGKKKQPEVNPLDDEVTINIFGTVSDFAESPSKETQVESEPRRAGKTYDLDKLYPIESYDSSLDSADEGGEHGNVATTITKNGDDQLVSLTAERAAARKSLRRSLFAESDDERVYNDDDDDSMFLTVEENDYHKYTASPPVTTENGGSNSNFSPDKMGKVVVMTTNATDERASLARKTNHKDSSTLAGGASGGTYNRSHDFDGVSPATSGKKKKRKSVFRRFKSWLGRSSNKKSYSGVGGGSGGGDHGTEFRVVGPDGTKLEMREVATAQNPNPEWVPVPRNYFAADDTARNGTISEYPPSPYDETSFNYGSEGMVGGLPSAQDSSNNRLPIQSGQRVSRNRAVQIAALDGTSQYASPDEYDFHDGEGIASDHLPRTSKNGSPSQKGVRVSRNGRAAKDAAGNGTTEYTSAENNYYEGNIVGDRLPRTSKNGSPGQKGMRVSRSGRDAKDAAGNGISDYPTAENSFSDYEGTMVGDRLSRTSKNGSPSLKGERVSRNGKVAKDAAGNGTWKHTSPVKDFHDFDAGGDGFQQESTNRLPNQKGAQVSRNREAQDTAGNAWDPTRNFNDFEGVDDLPQDSSNHRRKQNGVQVSRSRAAQHAARNEASEYASPSKNFRDFDGVGGKLQQDSSNRLPNQTGAQGSRSKATQVAERNGTSEYASPKKNFDDYERMMGGLSQGTSNRSPSQKGKRTSRNRAANDVADTCPLEYPSSEMIFNDMGGGLRRDSSNLLPNQGWAQESQDWASMDAARRGTSKTAARSGGTSKYASSTENCNDYEEMNRDLSQDKSGRMSNQKRGRGSGNKAMKGAARHGTAGFDDFEGLVDDPSQNNSNRLIDQEGAQVSRNRKVAKDTARAGGSKYAQSKNFNECEETFDDLEQENGDRLPIQKGTQVYQNRAAKDAARNGTVKYASPQKDFNDFGMVGDQTQHTSNRLSNPNATRNRNSKSAARSGASKYASPNKKFNDHEEMDGPARDATSHATSGYATSIMIFNGCEEMGGDRSREASNRLPNQEGGQVSRNRPGEDAAHRGSSEYSSPGRNFNDYEEMDGGAFKSATRSGSSNQASPNRGFDDFEEVGGDISQDKRNRHPHQKGAQWSRNRKANSAAPLGTSEYASPNKNFRGFEGLVDNPLQDTDQNGVQSRNSRNWAEKDVTGTGISKYASPANFNKYEGVVDDLDQETGNRLPIQEGAQVSRNTAVKNPTGYGPSEYAANEKDINDYEAMPNDHQKAMRVPRGSPAKHASRSGTFEYASPNEGSNEFEGMVGGLQQEASNRQRNQEGVEVYRSIEGTNAGRNGNQEERLQVPRSLAAKDAASTVTPNTSGVQMSGNSGAEYAPQDAVGMNAASSNFNGGERIVGDLPQATDKRKSMFQRVKSKLRRSNKKSSKHAKGLGRLDGAHSIGGQGIELRRDAEGKQKMREVATVMKSNNQWVEVSRSVKNLTVVEVHNQNVNVPASDGQPDRGNVLSNHNVGSTEDAEAAFSINQHKARRGTEFNDAADGEGEMRKHQHSNKQMGQVHNKQVDHSSPSRADPPMTAGLDPVGSGPGIDGQQVDDATPVLTNKAARERQSIFKGPFSHFSKPSRNVGLSKLDGARHIGSQGIELHYGLDGKPKMHEVSTVLRANNKVMYMYRTIEATESEEKLPDLETESQADMTASCCG
eukprot:scaffold6708_cov134-Cylindrotheca_fusiformis.AAC.20